MTKMLYFITFAFLEFNIGFNKMNILWFFNQSLSILLILLIIIHPGLLSFFLLTVDLSRAFYPILHVFQLPFLVLSYTAPLEFLPFTTYSFLFVFWVLFLYLCYTFWFNRQGFHAYHYSSLFNILKHLGACI